MAISEGFTGPKTTERVVLPPGQHLTHGFPVLSAGPTPLVARAAWSLTVTTTSKHQERWDFARLNELPVEDITVDLHCVTRWSKLATRWRGVPVAAVLHGVDDRAATAVMATSYGDYSTNLPIQDLLG